MKRLTTGGRIDRSQPLTARFDGITLPAFHGDTLASALLAGGVDIVGRSFKYHRPRGVYSAGVEEPGALVHLRDGARHEPNVRATTVEVFEGLVSSSQNSWPSRSFDVGALTSLLTPFLSAGFYYKTFIGPFRHSTRFWMMCETFIRRAAGMGRASYSKDPDSYEKRHAFCDVLVIGGGVAGLSAALAAGRAGAKVMLVEQDCELGGAILSEPVGSPADEWLDSVLQELTAMQNVRILLRTTVFGAYDGDTYGLVQRVSDHLSTPEARQLRQRYWVVQAKRAVMATGAIERPLVFGNNDKPGVMLAGAVRTYLNRFAVLVGEAAVICTNNDSAYATAADLARAGARVTLVDLRPKVPEDIRKPVTDAGADVLVGHGVVQAIGRQRVKAALVVPVDATGHATGPARKIPANLIAVSGGWSPVLHLWSHRYGKPVFDAAAVAFVPSTSVEHNLCAAGTALAASSLDTTIDQGFVGGAKAAQAAGASGESGARPGGFTTGPYWPRTLSPLWVVFDAKGRAQGKAFVDFQHDVKIADIDQAYAEGYVSVEHLKRYTTNGMATDQGKLSNVNALARMAELCGKDMPQIGTTTFRPPFTPVTIGALVGHEHGRHFRPTRRSPIHHSHVEGGGRMTEAGAWMRPWYYPDGDEDLRAAYIREAAHVREHVGIIDVSTLGKIAVQGPDSAEFLNRVYVNGWKTLKIGRLRYGVMLREDGFVMDDGVTARLGEHDYFMSTTTANAAKVLAFTEHLLQTTWRDLRVHVTTVTDQWAAIAVAGPNARALLASICDADLSREALPNNAFILTTIADVPLRIHRMSYSGELAFEIYVPSGFSRHIWEVLIAAGSAFNLRPYGTEAMGALRIEKGHVAGAEIEGRTTLKDLGLTGLGSTKKAYIGALLQHRPILADPERPVLIGLEIENHTSAAAGSLLFPLSGELKGHGEGWVSSTTWSPALGRNIALGLLKNGKARMGESIRVVNFTGNTTLRAKVVSQHFFDPQGDRQNG